MKIKNLYIAIVAAAMTLGMSSCNDYLDKQPDSRLDLQSPSDVSKLLVSAYPTRHPASVSYTHLTLPTILLV